VLSWIVGFVLVPVPGGVGVREAAFVAAAGSLDPGIAAATAVAARALFVLVDALGAALGALALRRAGEGDELQPEWTEDTA
jgi:glycosyltransferase 2 family protein